MTAVTAPKDALAQLKDQNTRSALLAAGGLYPLVEQLLIDGVETDDPDLRRKIAETVHKMALSMEPKQQSVVYAPLSFSIVTSDDIPQVAPPNRRPKPIPVQDVEDAVPVLKAALDLALGESWAENLFTEGD